MSPAELATEHGQERLAACLFRVSVGNDMVPMCQVNAGGVRERVYAIQGTRQTPVAARAKFFLHGGSSLSLAKTPSAPVPRHNSIRAPKR